MSKDIESRMRAALRPVAPRDEFSQRLSTQVAQQRRPQPKPRRSGAGGGK